MKKIITISREFGSGGRTIAKEAAQRLGYAFYDKDLIEKIAEESGLSREYIEAHGEHAPGRTYFGYAFVGRDATGNSVGDYLWKVQRDIIEDLAEKGNCVIVGRCADYILRKRTDCLHVFIHADMEKKKVRYLKKRRSDLCRKIPFAPAADGTAIWKGRTAAEGRNTAAPGKCRSIRGNNRIRKCTQPMIQQQVSMTG